MLVKCSFTFSPWSIFCADVLVSQVGVALIFNIFFIISLFQIFLLYEEFMAKIFTFILFCICRIQTKCLSTFYPRNLTIRSWIFSPNFDSTPHFFLNQFTFPWFPFILLLSLFSCHFRWQKCHITMDGQLHQLQYIMEGPFEILLMLLRLMVSKTLPRNISITKTWQVQTNNKIRWKKNRIYL